ncbi:MAG TPA: DNA-3-methyladenine glycosylase I [Candidatus Polarisedimenticolaceae bacterium]|nr:DNA-3-methyladenine glycosylase I [Candidatus Polarisedimenticolaceae bacterium]
MGQGGVIAGPDGRRRCPWCVGSEDYVAYHDHEWGYPVDDDRRLFEKLCLEGFQSGLSWLTILRKREAFRRAFAGFDFEAIAGFGRRDVARLMADAGIVRHRGKIESAIANAGRAVDLAEEFGSLAGYVWGFEPSGRGARGPGPSPAAAALSRDLKKRGWTFVGPTTAHAFAQAMGLLNDHLPGCVIRPRVEAARRAFRRPLRH